ncbi:hypothetical protein QCA50_006021 [Cerrena zonata]|uniref:MIF4G domain-containing protein n=1 Tax=Cerrena zonata TaxID=2478898 RepID=A0AAW0GL19_9APHY
MKPYNGPALPQSLLEEIDSSKAKERGGGHSNGRGRGKPSRKDARKQERQGKKQRKAEYFTGAQTHGTKRSVTHEHIDSPSRKKQKLDPSSSEKNTQKASRAPGTSKAPPTTKQPEKKEIVKRPSQSTTLEKLDSRSASKYLSKKATLNPGFIPKSRQEEEESAYISYLESKLGWKKGGKKSSKYGKGLDEDGLDELLQGLDELETSVFSTAPNGAEDEMSEESGEEDYDMSDTEGDASEDEEDEELSDDGQTEWGGIDEGGDFPEDSNAEEDNPVDLVDSAPATKYIPPHLRNRPAETFEDSEAKLKLIRQIKGQLNRMSEQNIGTIIDAIEEIYRNHRRHDVTSTITTLILDGISAHSILLDSYVVLHAAFVSALHKLIGVEFAAYFVQNLVSSYEKYFASLQTTLTISDQPQNDDQEPDPQQGKETSNLAVFSQSCTTSK